MSYVIFTTGRTGSQLIGFNIAEYFNIPFDRSIKIYQNYNPSSVGVYHSHYPTWVPVNSKDCTAIISRRRNLFDSILSSFVTIKTKEVNMYSNKVVEPFYVDPIDFEYRYIFEQAYYKIIDFKAFGKVIDVYYEDMLADNKHLFSLFGVDRAMNMNLTKKSSYRNHELISNIDELKTLFNTLISRPLTDVEIESTRSSVEDDIKTAWEYYKPGGEV